MALTERDRAVLDFERSWWTRGEPKGEAIRRCLQLSAARYYQILGRLLDSAEALEYDPLVVRRARLRRSLRREARFAGRPAPAGGPSAGGRPAGGRPGDGMLR